MKIKNLKLLKNICKYSGAFVLVNGIVIGGINVKLNYEGKNNSLSYLPMSNNKYCANHIYFNENTKDGKYTKDEYSTDYDIKNGKYILIKTPYYENKLKKIIRDVYVYNLDEYKNIDYDFINNNIKNQDLLLDKEYVKELVSYSCMESNRCEIIISENSDTIPNNNNYEVSSATIDIDIDDYELVSNNKLDKSFNCVVGSVNILGATYCLSKYSKKKKGM